jgi:hypothetical protein
MPVAEVVGELVVVGDGEAGLPQVPDERVVRRREVVAVHRVLDGELPVAAHRVALHARGGGHPLRADGGRHRHVVGRVSEVARQIGPVRVEGDEDEALVDVEAGDLTQRHVRDEVAALGISGGVGQRGQLAGVVERPRVVEALEVLGASVGLAAQDGAAVGAGVEVGADPPVPVPAEDQRAAAERAGAEVARGGDLGLVTEVEPGVGPDPVPLGLHDRGVAVGGAVHPERERLPVLADQCVADALVGPVGAGRPQARCGLQARGWCSGGAGGGRRHMCLPLARSMPRQCLALRDTTVARRRSVKARGRV